jgi:hypothetical protein
LEGEMVAVTKEMAAQAEAMVAAAEWSSDIERGDEFRLRDAAATERSRVWCRG